MSDLTKRFFSILLQITSEGSSNSTDSNSMVSNNNLSMYFPYTFVPNLIDFQNIPFIPQLTEPDFANNSWPQLTEQGIANVQNLHVINCMSNMTDIQIMQTLNYIHSVLLQNRDALELEARSHRTAAGKFCEIANPRFSCIINF